MGANQVMNMTTMIKDLALSQDLVSNFNQHIEVTGNPLGFEFNLQVLQQGTWP